MVMGENDVESQFSLKPPVMSLNDNMNFFGKKLQVQTENVDSRDPYILTQVFLHGRVIHSARCTLQSGGRDARAGTGSSDPQCI